MSDVRPIPFSSSSWIRVGVWVAGASLVALHLLQPDRSPRSTPLGAYALGDGGLLTLGLFLALTLALVGAGLGALQTLKSRRAAGLAALGLGIAAVATAAAGIFPSDGAVPPAFPGSLDGWVHRAAGIAALPFYLLGPLAFTLGTRGDPRWDRGRVGMTLLVVGIGAALGFLILAAPPLGLVGGGERALTGSLLAWLLLVGGHIRLLRRGDVHGSAIDSPLRGLFQRRKAPQRLPLVDQRPSPVQPSHHGDGDSSR